MITAYPEIFARLAEPWPPDEVRSLSKGGRTFGYLRADQVMTRLDDVLGPENWWDSYERDQAGSDSVLCRLTVRLPDGELLSKCDLGAPADMPDEGDAEKSAVSDALKRAAVKFGVGRWLRGPIPESCLAWLRDNGGRLPDSQRARPPGPGRDPAPAPPPAPAGPVQPAQGKRPTTGKQFYAWLMKRDEDPELKGIVKYIDQWARLQGMASKYVDWSADEVEQAWLEASRKLAERTRRAGLGVPGPSPDDARGAHHAHA